MEKLIMLHVGLKYVKNFIYYKSGQECSESDRR